MPLLRLTPADPGAQVADLMSPDPIAVGVGEPLSAVVDLMTRRRFRHVPVVDGDRPVGVISQRDMLGLPWPNSTRDSPLTQDSEILMRPDPTTVLADASAAEAAGHMLREKRGCLLVVDRGGALIGILTEADFLRAYLRNA
jgi:acetoin utilization protein AcuB